MVRRLRRGAFGTPAGGPACPTRGGARRDVCALPGGGLQAASVSYAASMSEASGELTTEPLPRRSCRRIPQALAAVPGLSLSGARIRAVME